MNKLKIGIMGASGRMGRMLIESTMNHPNTELGGAYVRSTSSLIGVDAGEFIGGKNQVLHSQHLTALKLM